MVSNLHMLLTVIEKAVVSRLTVHLSNNKLIEHIQLAYRPSYSTKTALVRITNAILVGLDYHT